MSTGFSTNAKSTTATIGRSTTQPGVPHFGWWRRGWSQKNCTRSVSSWLLYEEDHVVDLFQQHLPAAPIPEIEFDERIVMMSFSWGCLTAGNVLWIERAFIDSDLLLVQANIDVSNEGIEDSCYRPYNLTYVDVPIDGYYVEVDTDVIWPE